MVFMDVLCYLVLDKGLSALRNVELEPELDLEGVTHRNQQQMAVTVKENLIRIKTVISTLL